MNWRSLKLHIAHAKNDLLSVLSAPVVPKVGDSGKKHQNQQRCVCICVCMGVLEIMSRRHGCCSQEMPGNHCFKQNFKPGHQKKSGNHRCDPFMKLHSEKQMSVGITLATIIKYKQAYLLSGWQNKQTNKWNIYRLHSIWKTHWNHKEKITKILWHIMRRQELHWSD